MPSERMGILRILGEIATDPFPDGSRKHRSTSGHELLYNDGTYWVWYEILDALTIAVIGIGTVE